MNRLLAIMYYISQGEVWNAYRVAYNYYNEEEEYKGDHIQTVKLISEFMTSEYTDLSDVKRSINVVEISEDGDTYKMSKGSKMSESAKFNALDYNYGISIIHPWIKHLKMKKTVSVGFDF